MRADRVSAAHSRAGFSLVEIMVAAMIIVLVAAGILGMFVSGRRLSGTVDNRSLALNYAQDTLEHLKEAVSSDPARSGPLDVASSDMSAGLLLPGGSRVYTVEDIDLDGDLEIDARKVTVTVTWADDE